MILSADKVKEFKEAAAPLMKFLGEECHPHVQVVLDCSTAQLYEGVCSVVTEEFIKD